jgi:hypothetical protein
MGTNVLEKPSENWSEYRKGRTGDGIISKSIRTSDSVKGSFGRSDVKCATILEDR